MKYLSLCKFLPFFWIFMVVVVGALAPMWDVWHLRNFGIHPNKGNLPEALAPLTIQRDIIPLPELLRVHADNLKRAGTLLAVALGGGLLLYWVQYRLRGMVARQGLARQKKTTEDWSLT